MGNVVLKELVAGRSTAEIGYWTAPADRGRGLAPRALEAVTRWTFDTYRGDGLEMLELIHQVDNAASCRVAEKGGYGLDRVLPTRLGYPGEAHVHTRLD